MNLHHLTLNTGHVSTTTADDVDMEVVLPILTPILEAGGGPIPPLPGILMDCPPAPAGLVFLFRHGSTPVVLNAMAWDEESAHAMWAAIEAVYLQVSESTAGILLGESMPEMPKELPWLASLMLPGMALLKRDVISALGDLERCVAVTALHRQGLWS